MLPSRTDFLNAGLVPVTDRSQLPKDDDCVVCMTDDFIDPVALPCNHTFCRQCITLWLTQRHRSTCPTCRKDLFVLDDADRGPVGARRITTMTTALQHSGLQDGTYTLFNEGMYHNANQFLRATAQANSWLAEQNHTHAAGPAVVKTDVLGHHVLAMGNLLKGYARAMGRGYGRYQGRDWRNIIDLLWLVLEQRDDRTFDSVALANVLRNEVRVKLMEQGREVERFFDQEEGEAQSPAADLDILLQYVVKMCADEFGRQEMRRAAISREPTVIGKVGAWFNQYWHI